MGWCCDAIGIGWLLAAIMPPGRGPWLAGNGLVISNNTNFTIQIPQGEELWAVVSSGTHSVTVLTWAVETA